MSESMTVEHATELAKKLAALARANEDLCKRAIKKCDTLQARVAELEKREAAYDIILKVVSNALERAGVTECDNPGDAIEMITKERDGLLSQLPEGMKHCTIIFKECDKGHGWLTATNWVQHGCPKCEFDRIVDEKHELQRLRRQSSNMVSALHLEACQWRLKAEKAEQERDGLAAKCAELKAEWQPMDSCPNDVAILISRDNGSVELVEADDNDYNWQPYKGPRRPGVDRPNGWMPAPPPKLVRKRKGEQQ